MKKQLLTTIIIASTFLSSLSNAAETWPVKPADTKSAILYSLVSLVFFDSETSLQQNFGLHSNACTYTSRRTNKTYTYNKIGACAFEAAKDKLFSANLETNSIYIWANNNKNEEILFKLDWNPNITSFFSLIKQAGELQFEGLYRLLKLTPAYDNSILGNIKFTFKNDDTNQAALKNMLSELLPPKFEFLAGQASASDIMNEVQEIGINFSFDKNALRDADRYLLQNITVDVTLSKYILHFKGQSNINPLNSEREFSLDAKLNIESRGL